jgi:hypothetical protein
LDDSLIKTIAALRIDITQATQPLQALNRQFVLLDQQIQKVQASSMGIGRTIGSQVGQPVQQSRVILDRYGNVLSDVGRKAEDVGRATTQGTRVLGDHRQEVDRTAKAYSVLGSQWSRRISWFMGTNVLFQHKEQLVAA